MKLFYSIIILILSTIGLQKLVACVVGRLNKKIKGSFKRLKKYISDSKTNIEELKISGEKFKEEIGNFLLLEKKKEELGIITCIIGWLEILLFVFLTIALVKIDNILFVEKFKILSTIIMGWIALKIFGNYYQWSGTILGRSTFYIFLIGTIINILGAILIGFSVAYSFF